MPWPLKIARFAGADARIHVTFLLFLGLDWLQLLPGRRPRRRYPRRAVHGGVVRLRAPPRVRSWVGRARLRHSHPRHHAAAYRRRGPPPARARQIVAGVGRGDRRTRWSMWSLPQGSSSSCVVLCTSQHEFPVLDATGRALGVLTLRAGESWGEAITRQTLCARRLPPAAGVNLQGITLVSEPDPFISPSSFQMGQIEIWRGGVRFSRSLFTDPFGMPVPPVADRVFRFQMPSRSGE